MSHKFPYIIKINVFIEMSFYLFILCALHDYHFDEDTLQCVSSTAEDNVQAHVEL